MTKIANTIHFIFGMDETFGGRPFSFIHYLSILSAARVNTPEQIVLWYDYAPTDNPWWDAACQLCTMQHIEYPSRVFTRPLKHYAHRTDVLRLQILYEYGGIYLDLDTLSIRPITKFLNKRVVLGLQGGFGKEITNAVIMAQKDSSLLLRWLQLYRTFKSQGEDKYWDEHSAKLPKSTLLPKFIGIHTLLPVSAFAYPLPANVSTLFTTPDKDLTRKSYVLHLYESRNWRLLAGLTPDNVMNKGHEFSRLVTPLLALEHSSQTKLYMP